MATSFTKWGIAVGKDFRIKNLTIRQKLLLYQGLLILAFFLGVTVYLTTVYSNSLLKSEQKSIENSLQYLNGSISAQIEAIKSADLDVRVSSTIKDNLNQADYVQYGRAFTRITDFLNSKVFGISGLRHALIIDKTNHVYTVDLPLQLPESFQLEETGVYQAALQSPSKLVWLSENDIYDHYSLDYGDYRVRSDFHAASIIKNYTTGEIQGLLILTLNDNFFRNIAKSVPLMDSMKVYLVSPDLKKCYSLSDGAEPLSSEVMANIPLDENLRGPFLHNGELLTYEQNHEMGWFILGSIGLRTLRHDVEKYIFPLLAIIGVSLLVFFVLSNQVFNSMTKGINRLSDSMKQFETGDFKARVNNPSTDEIGQLSRSFNHMAAQIEDLIDTQYKMAVQTREAEFQSLQAQINPHFLYNTLDMLNWQLILHGEDRLSESVVALGNSLRYSISENGTCSTLQSEVDNIQNYVSIQSLINEKPVELTVDVKDAESIFLPKLTLQPLVENAFLHGFNGRDGNNSLSITGDYEDDSCKTYIITVRDNGVGMTEDQIAALKNATPLEGAHVGFANVLSRLQYMYKDNVEIKVSSKYGFETTIRIVLNLQGEIGDESDYH